MSFDNRSEFIEAQASTKVTLATVRGKRRIINWSLHLGSVYKKTVDRPVRAVYNGSTELVETADANISGDAWHYDPTTNELYISISGADPVNAEIIATFEFYYASHTLDAPYNLENTGKDVSWDGRIFSAPAFKHSIGIDQKLISTVGNGTLRLQNMDRQLDEIYDTYIFENQEVNIYSWNADMPISEARRIFRGRVTNKTYNTDTISFKIKDLIFDLQSQLPQSTFTESDNVPESELGNIKRWIWGRVDGLKLQTIDAIGAGIPLTGTVSARAYLPDVDLTGTIAGTDTSVTLTGTGTKFLTEVKVGDVVNVDSQSFVIESVDSDLQLTATRPSDGSFSGESATKDEGKTLVGVGTQFLTELSPDDELTIGVNEFDVEFVHSDTIIEISGETEFAFSGQSATYVPDIPLRTKNRTFFAADHTCAELAMTVVEAIQFNRIKVDDASGVEPGDFVEFQNGDRREVKNVAPGEIIVLRLNVSELPAPGEIVTREPMQQVYVEGTKVDDELFTVNNGASLTVTLAQNTEFELAKEKNTNITFTFTNGSRSVTTTSDIDLEDLYQPRDYIRPTAVLFTTWYEILDIRDNEIILRQAFADPTHTGLASFKQPKYIGDSTIVSGNVLGRTTDGTANGTWIRTVAQASRDVISAMGIPYVNEQSFIDGNLGNTQLVSYMAPLSPGSSLTKAKQFLDDLNISINSAITLDNNLDLQFRVLQATVDNNPVTMYDYDVVGWNLKSTSGDSAKRTIVRYRFTDVDRNTLDDSNHVAEYTSQFVENYIGTDLVSEFDVYLYNDRDAQIMAERKNYLGRLARADITVQCDLRFEDIEIGDSVILGFSRLYKRLGDANSRKKVVVVVGKKVTGQSIEFTLSDLGNVYNTSAIITDNAAPDYASALEDDKLVNGYITNTEGIVNTDEDSQNTNLIS